MKTTTRSILLVTEAAFYPPYRGDSCRLSNLICNLQRRGWQVCVVHLHDHAQPDMNYAEMAKRCDDLSIYYPTEADLRQRAWSEMDTYCPSGLVKLVEERARRVRPQVLLTQFVFLSRCLEIVTEFGRPVRVIDADNKFTGLAQTYQETGVPYEWFSTDEAQERQGLLRADLILAIQEREAEYFSSLVPERPVLIVPHLASVYAHFQPMGETLLFVGAANLANASGIKHFLDAAFPLIRQRHPNVRLRIAGRVCELLEGVCEQVEFLNLVDDLNALYAEAAIVLNPTPVGSGLKVKTVEALCHGKCLVTTRHGAQGLENYSDLYCLAETPTEFAETIISLLDEPSRIRELGQRALKFAETYFNPGLVLRRLDDAVLAQMNKHEQ